MLLKSGSFRFVEFAAAILAALFCISLELTPVKPIAIPGHPAVPVQSLVWMIYGLLLFFLTPTALSALGIRIRSRSVEQLHAGGRDRDDVATVELPIRIYRGRWLVRVVPVSLFLGGLACLVLALCLVLAWFPPPRAREDPLPLTLGSLGMGFVLMAGAFLARRCKPALLCEISEKGIRAPDGFWGRQTLVLWEELARCEIIHDDERIWYDHFVLWDRAGRRRFQSSKTWLGRLKRSDRTRILLALRSRFPQKEKFERDAEPALAGAASSAVWDWEFDG